MTDRELKKLLKIVKKESKKFPKWMLGNGNWGNIDLKSRKLKQIKDQLDNNSCIVEQAVAEIIYKSY